MQLQQLQFTMYYLLSNTKTQNMKTRNMVIACFLMFAIGSSYAQSDKDINIDKVYAVNKNGTLHLDSDDADVSITGSDRSDVHVQIQRKVDEKGIVMGSRDFRIEISERDGDLYIKDFEENGSITVVGYYSEQYKIDIELPKSMSLKIKGDDDDYKIANVNGEIRMDVDDGDAHLTNCRGNYFDFDFDDGDIEVDMAAGILKLDIDDGDVEINNAAFTEITADIDDGDIYIKTSLDKDGQYTFYSDDGNIDLGVLGGGGEFTIRHDDSSISSSEEFERISKEDSKSVYRLSNGGAVVKMRCDDARIRLRAL